MAICAFLYNIKDEYENPTEYYVDDMCNVYLRDGLFSYKPMCITIRKKDKRPVVTLNINGISKTYLTYRLLMRAKFNIDYNTFKSCVIDHIDGDPSHNAYDNLEIVSQSENMKRAGENNLMRYGEDHFNSKYKNSLIESICRDICNNMSRSEIMEKYNVNGQLIDDIRSGRSHKKISSKFLDMGFKYKEYDRSPREDMARNVCELLSNGKTVSEVSNITGYRYDFVYAIYTKRTFKDISDKYTF